MPVTMQQVLGYLNADEPDYPRAAQLGPDALPHLETLVAGTDSMLASKSAYLAGLIGDARAVRALARAAQSPDAAVRTAAAAATAHMPAATVAPVLASLLADSDGEVRRVALGSIPSDVPPALRSALEKMARDDPYMMLRQRSTEILDRFVR